MRSLLPLLLFLSPPFWEIKPPEKWTDGEIEIIRHRSPWTQSLGPGPEVPIWLATAAPIEEADKLLDDAMAIAQAGAFCIVVEGTVEPVARSITEAIEVPTIGIGASADCDGQIIVAEDILGLFGTFTPKFVKRYAELGDEVSSAVAKYAADVRARRFPGPDQVFGAKLKR